MSEKNTRIVWLLRAFPKAVVLFVLRLYRCVLSPLLPGQCRFAPSCSHYAIQAVEKKGILRGLLFTCFRLLRCQPFCAGGLDPVK